MVFGQLPSGRFYKNVCVQQHSWASNLEISLFSRVGGCSRVTGTFTVPHTHHLSLHHGHSGGICSFRWFKNSREASMNRKGRIPRGVWPIIVVITDCLTCGIQAVEKQAKGGKNSELRRWHYHIPYLKHRWRGRGEGGLGWGIHVNPWLIHVNVWQKPLQYCKVISLQLTKTNGKKNSCKVAFILKVNKLAEKLPKEPKILSTPTWIQEQAAPNPTLKVQPRLCRKEPPPLKSTYLAVGLLQMWTCAWLSEAETFRAASLGKENRRCLPRRSLWLTTKHALLSRNAPFKSWLIACINSYDQPRHHVKT